MRLLCRFMGAMVLLLSTVGIVCCVAGVVAIWVVHQSVAEKVRHVTARLDDGLQRASAATHHVERALEQARASVDRVNTESASLVGTDAKNRLATSTLRKLIQQQLGPKVHDLYARLITLSEAATALSSLLQSFQELPVGQTDRIQPDKLKGWSDQAAQLSTTFGRLEVVLGDGNRESNQREIAAASNAVDLALQRCQAKMDDWQSELEVAREGLQSVQREILHWLTPATIVGTFLCVWVAAGQISLFARASHWCRGV